MLLITRRPGEAIMINGEIAVKVVDIRGGRVKLGFEFPQGNTVYREELFTKIQAENKAAALAGGPLPADVLRHLPSQQKPDNKDDDRDRATDKRREPHE